MTYEDTPVLSKTKKNSIMIISEMSTTRILWYVTKRHKLAIAVLYGLALTAYVVYTQFMSMQV
jgi:hypothetical protein